MSAAEQLAPWKDPEQRRRRIGSSDAAAVCGVDPYCTELRKYLEMRGEIERELASDPAYFGTLLEPVVLRVLAVREGVEVIGRDDELEPTIWRPDGSRGPAPYMEPDLLDTLVHPDVPWMVAHLDGVLLGEGFAEAKTAGFFARGWDDADDGIPGEHLVQIHHAAAILRALGQPYAVRVPLLKGGQRWVVYRPAISHDLCDAIMEREAAFRRRVAEGRAPDPTARDIGVLQQLYPRHQDIEVEAAPEIMDALADMARAHAEKKAAEERIDAGGALVRDYMREAQRLTVAGRNAVSWTTAKDTLDIDWRAALGALCERLAVPEDEQIAAIAAHTTMKPGTRRFMPRWDKLPGLIGER